MKSLTLRRIACLLGASALTVALAAAQNGNGNGNGGAGNGNGNGNKDPGYYQEEPGGPKVIIHGTNPKGEQPTAGTTSALTPITNHGGPVMTTPTTYLIWYGNWNQSNGSDTPAGQGIVRDFLHGLSGSAYFQINTTYGGPSGMINAGSETTVSARANSRMTDNDVFSVVSNAITSHKLPADPNGVYFVLTSSDIAKSGFCNQYCGWHTDGTVNGVDIKFSFVGNANRCLNNCAAQTVGPNGNAGVDGMVSVIAHELEESNTDPDLNAWYDKNGAENADKCAWTFGQNQSIANGAYYNMTLPTIGGSTRNYLVQRNLSANDNKCYVNFVTKAQ